MGIRKLISNIARELEGSTPLIGVTIITKKQEPLYTRTQVLALMEYAANEVLAHTHAEDTEYWECDDCDTLVPVPTGMLGMYDLEGWTLHCEDCWDHRLWHEYDGAFYGPCGDADCACADVAVTA